MKWASGVNKIKYGKTIRGDRYINGKIVY